MNPGSIDFLAPLRITGADAAGFLHGQITTDVTGLAPGQTGFSAWCDPKGRVLATFILARLEQTFWLLLPHTLKETFMTRMKMYVLRADVNIVDAGAAEERIPELPTYVAPMDDCGWEATFIRHGIPWITPATSGRFLPQELKLEHLDALSYTKGCYPGQEIIARLRFRGQVKRGVCHAVTDNSTLLAPGAGLALPGDEKNIGTVVNSVGTDKGQELLVVLEHDHIEAGKVVARDFPDCLLQVYGSFHTSISSAH